MGSDACEVIEALPFPYDMKVHSFMCTELINLVSRVSKILQEAEAARPRCSTGFSSLCSLNTAIGKAKLLLQHCSESSKLYLALTGDAILKKCQKSRKLVEQSLCQLQNLVPIMLAAEISRTINDLRVVVLRLDPLEEDAGKVLRELLQMYKSPMDSTDETIFNAFQVALLRLQITSQKDLLIENRSIKKQLDKVPTSDPMKRKILIFLQHLLKNYGKLAVNKQKENDPIQREEPMQLSSSNGLSVERDSHLTERTGDAQVNMSSLSIIPEEFKCPLSLRLMYDPVVIASGQTFERMWIQRWFDEGHNVCPKTKKKLDHLSLTSNNVMKNLIVGWCARTGVTLPDPSTLAVSLPLESSSSSIGSLSSSLKDLALPIDLNNLFIGSSDCGQGSDYCEAQIDGIHLSSMSTADSCGPQFRRSTTEINMEILFELDRFPWEYKCKVIKDIERFLSRENQTCSLMSFETLIQPLLKFLKDAYELHDVEALRTGCLLFSASVEKCSSSTIPYLEEETYKLLASFLDTEVAEETLAVLEMLSSHSPCDKEIAASGALDHFLRILDKEISGLQEPALKILCNLSATSEIKSLIVPYDFIPKLIALFEDNALARFCVRILKNLCDNEDARVFVAQSDGCIASLIELLERGSQDVQEDAVAILLSLCSQRIQYCQLVMEQCVVPPLVDVSNKGTNKGKAMAMELLRILRDEASDTAYCSESEIIVYRDPSPPSKDRKSSRKVQGIFGKMLIFSKRGSCATKMKK